MEVSVLLLLVLVLAGSSAAAGKPHVISFGKSMSVQWLAATASDAKPAPLKLRPLIVDGSVKEYVVGASHEVTERLFVVRRAFRVNDSLPDDAAPKWQWQRGGWLLVDRVTGRISTVNLPDFDVVYSAASWYRDYVAYCGVSDDGKKMFAVVAQLSRRKPIVRKLLADGPAEDAAPDSACSVPAWQRSPVRVSFEAASSEKQTFSIRGHVVDVVNDEEDGE